MKLTDTFVTRYRPIFERIAWKATRDEALVEDAVQEAFTALLTEVPDQKPGTVRNPGAYIRQVAHFAILSFLQSPKKGNWYTGRKVQIKGKPVQHRKARYVGLDRLLRGRLVQITDKGQLVPGSRVNARGDSEYAEQIEDTGYVVRVAL